MLSEYAIHVMMNSAMLPLPQPLAKQASGAMMLMARRWVRFGNMLIASGSLRVANGIRHEGLAFLLVFCLENLIFYAMLTIHVAVSDPTRRKSYLRAN